MICSLGKRDDGWHAPVLTARMGKKGEAKDLQISRERRETNHSLPVKIAAQALALVRVVKGCRRMTRGGSVLQKC